MSELKSKVRPIYSELQGLLREAPTIGDGGGNTTSDSTLWEHLNFTIDELNSVSGDNFTKFKIVKIERGQFGNLFVRNSEYRSKLGGLIARVHGTYFFDEPAPFAGMPVTTINLSNQQEQSQHQSIVNELIPKINEKLKIVTDSNERDFLNELKDTVSIIKDSSSLIATVTDLAIKYGLPLSQIKSLVGI